MAQSKRITYLTTFSKFTTVRLIAEGGTGFVYEVEDESHTHFALKIIKPQRVTDDIRGRFKNEILFSQRTVHPNIISIVDYGILVDNGISLPFYVMPIYDASLRSLMKGGLSPDRVLPLFLQILNGAEAAHILKVIHRDIKPENILYDSAKSKLVLADFGIARFQQEELYTAVETRASDRLANFQYAAPEQRTRGLEVDHRADIYALGLILNEMFTGQVPQGTGYKTIGSVSAKFAYLDDSVTAMIRQAPGERPQSIDSIKQELIARGAESVSQQKLDQLKATVIPTSTIDDPLINDPVRIIDVDWTGGILTLILNHPVNDIWVSALQNMGNFASVIRKGPEAFTFNEDKAVIQSSSEQEAQLIIDYFKGWMPAATKKYEEMLRENQRLAEEQKRQQLQAMIQAEEAKARLRRNIKL